MSRTERALAPSDTLGRIGGDQFGLILTGIARFDNHLVATILDTQTFASQVVSQVPNHDGWQLVGIGGDPAKMQTLGFDYFSFGRGRERA